MDQSNAVEPTDAQARLKELVAEITDVAVLPAVFRHIMEVVNDPDANAADLKAVVECDPALTSRVLKRVNSAYFGLRSRVSNLQMAISLLGFTAIRNLALTVSVSDMFQEDRVVASYSRSGLWEHMVCVALCSRMIARRTMIAEFEDAYLGGLLHDIGIVLLDRHVHDGFLRAVNLAGPELELRFCERKAIGFDHADLGGAIADKWRFPESIVETIRWHHAPHRADPDSRAMTCAVGLADFLCGQKGRGPIAIKAKPRMHPSLLTELNLSRDDLRVLWEDIDEEIEAATDLLKL